MLLFNGISIPVVCPVGQYIYHTQTWKEDPQLQSTYCGTGHAQSQDWHAQVMTVCHSSRV